MNIQKAINLPCIAGIALAILPLLKMQVTGLSFSLKAMFDLISVAFSLFLVYRVYFYKSMGAILMMLALAILNAIGGVYMAFNNLSNLIGLPVWIFLVYANVKGVQGLEKYNRAMQEKQAQYPQ